MAACLSYFIAACLFYKKLQHNPLQYILFYVPAFFFWRAAQASFNSI